MQVRGEKPALDRVLGDPFALAATVLLLVTIYGWTFLTNPGRPAPADDPAYVVWRTEALLVDSPATVMSIDGPNGMHSTGYRVTTPVIAGLMRTVLGVDTLTPSALLAVGCRVLIALLLAGLAYLHVRDLALWHVAAIASGSILLTPLFGGYTDNMIALALVTASLYLLESIRRSWPARIAFGGVLTIAGLTHPTTFVIFCGTLVLVAAMRAFFDGDRRVDELIAAAVAAAIVFVVWRSGLWGPDAPLKEAALPPPGTPEFFRERLAGWLAAIRPVPNAVLIGCGAAGLSLWSRRNETGLARVTFAWLVPLVGALGALTTLAYPYYRFFNSTLAWVLLLGVGAYFALRASRRLNPLVGGITVAAVVVVIGTNYAAGVTEPAWSDPAHAWITPQERRDLDALHGYLRVATGDVIFVVDSDKEESAPLYGFVKRAGNVARYGVPAALQDRTHVYLGSVENLLAGRATPGDAFYESLSQATLEEFDEVGPEDEVVVAEVFNRTGASTEVERESSVLYVADGRLSRPAPQSGPLVSASGIRNWAQLLVGALLLLTPGFMVARALLAPPVLPYAGFAVAVGVALLAGATIVVLAITGDPLTPAIAWTVVIVCNAGAGVLAVTQRRRAAGRLSPA